MDKKKLLKMIQAKEEERQALSAKAQASTDVDELRSIQGRMDSLNSDITELRGMVADIEAAEQAAAKAEEDRKAAEKAKADEEARSKAAQAEAEKRAKGGAAYTPGKGFNQVDEAGTEEARAKAEKETMETRGKDLREGRSVTVATSNIVLPQVTSATINNPFQQVSSLIDNVDILPLNGGESYTQAYEISVADGTTTAEGAAATDTDTTFGMASINKAKITAYSEITEEVLKLPNADYANRVLSNIRVSLRKKLAKEILVGTGEANHMVGIFTDKATAINAATDISLSAIDKDTLDTLVFAYGGDEAVEGMTVLILSKADLAAFAKLRTDDGHKYHDIKTNGGFGTIDGYPFLINSACGALSKTATTAGTYCMAYGNLKNYQMAIFSDVDIQRSTDYKFKEGMIANRGVVFAGGNVVSYNGFIRVKKSA